MLQVTSTGDREPARPETDGRTGSLTWVKDDDPRWDADRERVFATVGPGVFPGRAASRGSGCPVTGGGSRTTAGSSATAGSTTSGATRRSCSRSRRAARGTGAGAFALARLEEEAAARGLNYVVNVVRDTHPDRDAVTAWFLAHGFTGTDDGRLRKQVGDRARDIGQHQAGRPGHRPGRAAGRSAAGALRRRAGPGGRPGPGCEDAAGGSDLGPGARGERRLRRPGAPPLLSGRWAGAAGWPVVADVTMSGVEVVEGPFVTRRQELGRGQRPQPAADRAGRVRAARAAARCGPRRCSTCSPTSTSPRRPPGRPSCGPPTRGWIEASRVGRETRWSLTAGRHRPAARGHRPDLRLRRRGAAVGRALAGPHRRRPGEQPGAAPAAAHPAGLGRPGLADPGAPG